ISAMIGVAVLLLVWGLQDYLTRRFYRDCAWMAQTALRFSPNPINPARWTIIYYAAFCAVLALLVFITPNPAFAVVFWLILLAVPKIVVEVLWQKRRRMIDRQLPAA